MKEKAWISFFVAMIILCGCVPKDATNINEEASNITTDSTQVSTMEEYREDTNALDNGIPIYSGRTPDEDDIVEQEEETVPSTDIIPTEGEEVLSSDNSNSATIEDTQSDNSVQTIEPTYNNTVGEGNSSSQTPDEEG